MYLCVSSSVLRAFFIPYYFRLFFFIFFYFFGHFSFFNFLFEQVTRLQTRKSRNTVASDSRNFFFLLFILFSRIYIYIYIYISRVHLSPEVIMAKIFVRLDFYIRIPRAVYLFIYFFFILCFFYLFFIIIV